MSEPRHVWQTNYPDNRILRVLDEARAAVRAGGWYAPLAEAVAALDAPVERWAAKGREVWRRTDEMRRVRVCVAECYSDAENIAAALNAQERNP